MGQKRITWLLIVITFSRIYFYLLNLIRLLIRRQLILIFFKSRILLIKVKLELRDQTLLRIFRNFNAGDILDLLDLDRIALELRSCSRCLQTNRFRSLASPKVETTANVHRNSCRRRTHGGAEKVSACQ